MRYVAPSKVSCFCADIPAGKYWHRHRRPRPVEYNADAEYHLNLQREAEQARVAAKRRRPPPSQVDEQKAAPEDGDAEPETPVIEVPADPPSALPPTRAMSPMSTASSASESPLAQRISRAAGAASAPPEPITQDASGDTVSNGTAPPAGSPPQPPPSAPHSMNVSAVGVLALEH